MWVGKEQKLLELARLSVEEAFRNEDNFHDDLSGEDESVSGVFVTLIRNGKLRGCKGCVEGDFSLAETVWRVARSSAFEDPRFSALTETELEGLEFSISILGPMERVRVTDPKEFRNQLRLGIDGLCVRLDDTSALFLPEVATEQGWDEGTTLSRLCLKAGLNKDSWLSSQAEIYRFQTREFSDSEA